MRSFFTRSPSYPVHFMKWLMLPRKATTVPTFFGVEKVKEKFFSNHGAWTPTACMTGWCLNQYTTGATQNVGVYYTLMSYVVAQDTVSCLSWVCYSDFLLYKPSETHNRVWNVHFLGSTSRSTRFTINSKCYTLTLQTILISHDGQFTWSSWLELSVLNLPTFRKK